MIRLMQDSDLAEIKKIHEKYYKKEFTFPDFNKFLANFVIVHDNQIISAGGVRTIAESVLITNKDLSPRARRAALYDVLNASAYICQKNEYHELHAFIQEDNWYNQLKRIGFKDCVGKALVIGVE